MATQPRSTSTAGAPACEAGQRPVREAGQRFERCVSGKFLTFRLGNEEYGVEILKVREIIGLLEITAVPQMPPYLRGVINLRGKVIPVVDLRLKFGLPPAEYDNQTCVIVVDTDPLMGIIVDRVQEVFDISAEQVEPPPLMGAAVDTDFLLGLGKVRNEVKILLNIDRVLALDEENVGA